MSKWFRENAPISARELTDEFQRLKRGSVTRRHFLGVTGLGLAAAVLARQPGLFNSAAYAQQEDLGTSMSLATWPNYPDPATFEAFTAGFHQLRSGSSVVVNGAPSSVVNTCPAGTARFPMAVRCRSRACSALADSSTFLALHFLAPRC